MCIRAAGDEGRFQAIVIDHELDIVNAALTPTTILIQNFQIRCDHHARVELAKHERACR